MQEYPVWEKTAQDLLRELDKHNIDAWPKTPESLTHLLRRMTPAFEEFGLQVEFLPRERNRRLIRITNTEYSEGNCHDRHQEELNMDDQPY